MSQFYGYGTVLFLTFLVASLNGKQYDNNGTNIKSSLELGRSQHVCYECRTTGDSCASGSCEGVTCATTYSTLSGVDTVIENCVSLYMPDECIHSHIAGDDSFICYCNSDYCNGGRQPLGPTYPPTSSVNGQHRCYECQKDSTSCQTGSCTGATCTKIEGHDSSDDEVIAGCQLSFSPDGCDSTVYNIVNVDICYCNSDYCNGVGKFSGVSAAIVLGLAIQLIAVTIFP